MMKNTIIVSLLALVLLFGCINLGEQPAEPTPEPEEVEEEEPETETVVEIEEETEHTVVHETPPPEEVPPEEEPDTTGYIYEPNAQMFVYFINVGVEAEEKQGDAILIKKGDFDMLIDAGNEETSSKLVSFLSTRVDDIEVLVSTHDDPEHSGGMETVIDNYYVEEFWWTGNSFSDESLPIYEKIQG